MPDLLIRNINKDTLSRLKAKADKNNRSLQGELHQMIKEYAGSDVEEARNMVREILEEYRTEGRSFTDSTDDVRELRNR